MALRIKGTVTTDNLIELVDDKTFVLVKINGEIVADFHNDGTFTFYGKTNEIQHTGRWDK